MSQWTQVAGSIRIDAFLGLGSSDELVRKELEKRLGAIVQFDSPEEEWARTDKTPMGSEGGIHYEYIVTAKDESSLSRGVVLIDASLRDFDTDDVDEIGEWLNRAFGSDKDAGFFVRQGVVQCSVEGKEIWYFIWDDRTNRFKKVQTNNYF